MGQRCIPVIIKQFIEAEYIFFNLVISRRDITRLKKYRLDLEYRDALSRQAEISANIGHYIFSEKSERYLYVSPGLARIHGVTPEQLMDSVQSVEDDIADVIEDDYELVAAV